MATVLTALGAIVVWFQTDTVLPTLLICGPNDNPWVCEVPENKPLPVCAIMHNGETPDWSTESSYQETTQIQFQVFAATAALTEQIAMAVKNRFDWQNSALTILNARETSIERTNYKLDRVELVRGRNTEIVFQASLDYNVQITRNLGS
jgi:hypothetical protein